MNYPTVVNGIDFRDLVFMSGQETETDTFKVAKVFKREHKDVLRKTRSVIKSCSPEFAERNFTLCHENNELQNGKPQPFYQMTKDGWMMLVMGFTGAEARVEYSATLVISPKTHDPTVARCEAWEDLHQTRS
ncbi:Rha family transcriptional regulator [Xenorhabdus bovienii]|uniref:Rha family transcriptional regulator n=1 Tax=Xenorhabdus bovienii TaxID=40576 RepID=UPI003DA4E859